MYSRSNNTAWYTAPPLATVEPVTVGVPTATLRILRLTENEKAFLAMCDDGL